VFSQRGSRLCDPGSFPPTVQTVGTTSSAARVAAVGWFPRVVAALDLYDLIRRTTCSGVFFVLGSIEPSAITRNVLPKLESVFEREVICDNA
jgi:hypothetical protein